jgi:hypothetical protein
MNSILDPKGGLKMPLKSLWNEFTANVQLHFNSAPTMGVNFEAKFRKNVDRIFFQKKISV